MLLQLMPRALATFRSHSSMDKTSVCGTDAPGSTPGESTKKPHKRKAVIALSLFFTAFFIVVLGVYTYQNSQDTFKLTILHFNDLHSRLLPSEFTDGSECVDKETCVGGVARLKTLITTERSASQNVLVVTSGDVFQGSPFFSIFGGKLLAEILNTIDIDFMSLGNHEFDNGDDALADFVSAAHFSVIGGNVHFASSTMLQKKVLPYTIQQFGTQKVGIIAAVTSDTETLSSPDKQTTFEDEELYLNSIATQLHNEGITIIIALTHVGYEKDKRIAQSVPFIDVIVGGHSDSYLSNTDQNAEGPYPTVVTGPNEHKTLIVQTKPYGAQLGKLSLTFDSAGEIHSYSGEPITIDSAIIENVTLADTVETLSAQISSSTKKVVGYALTEIGGTPTICRKQECELGNLVTDSLLSYGEKFGATVAVVNSGSIRSSIASGTIQNGDILNALPFDNTVSYGFVTGKELVEMFEKGVSNIETKSGAFLQVSGLQVSFNTDKENGRRICKIIDLKTNSVVQEDEKYIVVTNAYLAHGGDGYTQIHNASDSSTHLYEVLENYLAEHQNYKPKLDGRIVNQCPQ